MLPDTLRATWQYVPVGYVVYHAELIQSRACAKLSDTAVLHAQHQRSQTTCGNATALLSVQSCSRSTFSLSLKLKRVHFLQTSGIPFLDTDCGRVAFATGCACMFN
jgi:hypothetical protein